MRYSEERLRRSLALVRIVVGVIYIGAGYARLFDLTYFERTFLPRLGYWQTAVAPWYSWAYEVIWDHPHRWNALFGTTEMFIGVALLLGLATRPACLVGLLYVLHSFALDWYPGDEAFRFLHFLEIHLEQIALGCLFLLLGLGHAGDRWGLGWFYHRYRLGFRNSQSRRPRNTYFESEPEATEEDSKPETVEAAEVQAATEAPTEPPAEVQPDKETESAESEKPKAEVVSINRT